MRYYLRWLVVLLLTSTVQAAPFGDKDDVSYASSLWKTLESAYLVGADSIQTVPYAGQPPHGKILQTLVSTVTVYNTQTGSNGDTGIVIVKRNYGGDNVNKETVANDPDQYLKAVTVMFKRQGYDPENQDWFWAKFKPNGVLHVNPKNMKLAGQVQGCIACHKGAKDGDYVFNHDLQRIVKTKSAYHTKSK